MAVNRGRVYLLVVSREQNLVVVAIHNQTIGNSLLDIVRATVIVHDQISPLVRLGLLLRSVLLLRLLEVLLHILEHLLHVLHAWKSLHVEWKSLSSLHVDFKFINNSMK